MNFFEPSAWLKARHHEIIELIEKRIADQTQPYAADSAEGFIKTSDLVEQLP